MIRASLASLGVMLFAGLTPNGASAQNSTRPAHVTGNRAAGFGFSSPSSDNGMNLSEINRHIAIEIGDQIKAGRLVEAQAQLDEAEKKLRAAAAAAHLELWDRSIAPIMRLIDSRRMTIQAAQSQSTQPSDSRLLASPRMTPDQNRALAAIKADLNIAVLQMRGGQLTEAERTLLSVRSRLRALSGNVRLPIWSIPIATTFQAVDATRSELKSRQLAAKEAEEKNAASTQPASDQAERSARPTSATAPAFAALTSNHLSTKDYRAPWVGREAAVARPHSR
jgi:hypothetical protein